MTDAQKNLWARADLVQRMHRPGTSVPAPVTAFDDIQAERRRQQNAEGWTHEHDDAHDRGEMVTAARCYLTGNSDWWPWSRNWWKPQTRRRDLVRAGALALAESERLHRAIRRYPHSTITKASQGLGLFASTIQQLQQNERAARALMREIMAEIDLLDRAALLDTPADGDGA